MRKIGLIVYLLVATGCANIQLVSPYDEVIDTGLKEYKEEINTLAKNMADSAGKKVGTYDENQEAYNALESKIELLIERAAIQGNGEGCRLTGNVTEKVTKIMKGNSVPIAKGEEEGDSYGCTVWLLTLIKAQLDSLQMIHRTTDKCNPIGYVAEQGGQIPSKVSCLRAATSGTAMKISNQSINAAWVVETAKKTAKEE